MLLVLKNNPAYTETIKVATIDWCPQICADKEYPGFAVDTIKMIFEDSPYELDIEVYPWTRAIDMVHNGEAHALLGPVKSEAPGLHYPDNEIGRQRVCFWTKTDSQWRYTGIDSLKKLQIGIGYDITLAELNSYFEKNKHQFQPMSVNDEYIIKNAKKLEYGRIDTFVATYFNAMYELKAAHMESRVRVAGCTKFERFYMAFSRNINQSNSIEKMVKYFDEKMNDLRRSGKVAHIMQRYGLEDWQEIK